MATYIPTPDEENQVKQPVPTVTANDWDQIKQPTPPPYFDAQLMVNALVGGMPSYPPGPSAPKLDEMTTSTFNDQPTPQQQMRSLTQRNENWAAAKNPNVPTVLPPSVLTDDKITGTVFPDNPETPKVFHPGNFLPPSYGAGRYKIYTPNMVVPPIPGDAIAQLIEKLNKKK